MWPFPKRKKSEPAPIVTGDNYALWLRAHRPSTIEWFVGLDPLKQEALAEIGDRYLEHCVEVTTGSVEDDPAPRSDQESMEAAAEQMARKLLQSGPPLTTAGFQKRAAAAQESRKRADDSVKSFMGRAPDGGA